MAIEAVPIDPAILYWGTPVVLLSTVNADGGTNLAPMSSAWWLGWGCMLGLSESAHTVANLRRTGQCVLNLPSVDQADAVNHIAGTTGADPVPPDKAWLGFTHEAEKFNRAKMTPIASTVVDAPRAAECPVQMEATVEGIHAFGESNPSVPMPALAIELRIVAIHAHPNILFEENPRRIDPDAWRPLIMSFRELYGLDGKASTSRLAEIDEELWRPPVRGSQP
ncbi:MAG: flavin reductase family protein [Acidimicrobiales bacterium]